MYKSRIQLGLNFYLNNDYENCIKELQLTSQNILISNNHINLYSNLLIGIIAFKNKDYELS